jgi:hypothetical protein
MPESEVPDKFVPYSAVNVLPNSRTIPHLGMRMLSNSEIAVPNYDVVQHGLQAWQDTRATL